MNMTDNELRDFYKNMDYEPIMYDLEEFLDARQNYLKDKSGDNLLVLQIACDKIYTSTKSLWVNRAISENTFWMLKDELMNINR